MEAITRPDFFDTTNTTQRTRMCATCPGRPVGKSPDLKRQSSPHRCHSNFDTQACAANLVGTVRHDLVQDAYYEEIGF